MAFSQPFPLSPTSPMSSSMAFMSNPGSPISVKDFILQNASNYRMHYQTNSFEQHIFEKTSFFNLTYCHHCSDLIWGIHKQGLVCHDCNFTCHERCRDFVVSPCIYMKLDTMKKPKSHWMKEVRNTKKVFCNVCRSKITNARLRCEVCKYYSHPDCRNHSVSDCLESATQNGNCEIALSKSTASPHHWVEGNLPSSAHCKLCGKTCGSSECLIDLRCVRCGTLCHTRCVANINPICDFGNLKGMLLPPLAVAVIPHGDDSIVPIQGTKTEMHFHRSEHNYITSEVYEVREEESLTNSFLSSLSLTASSSSNTTTPTTLEETRFIKVSDQTKKNNDSTATISRTIKITSSHTVYDVIRICTRKFRLYGSPDNYYLVLPACPITKVPEDRSLAWDTIAYELVPSSVKMYLTLKYKAISGDTLSLKIYTAINTSDADTCNVIINPSFTVEDVIEKALQGFHVIRGSIEPQHCELHRYIYERGIFYFEKLKSYENIWNATLEDRKSPVSWAHFTRYFLKESADSKYTVSINTLPVGRSNAEYCKLIIPDSISKKTSLIAAFEDSGIVIMSCEDEATTMTLISALQYNEFGDKSPHFMILPSIETSLIDPLCAPLLVFVNSKSGGGQGKELISGLRRHINPHQIFDLANGGPIPGIFAFKDVKQYRVLICGGDGTFGWVLQALDETEHYRVCKRPQCALLPLGTGNDLARALKWGGGYTGQKPMEVLTSIDNSNPIEFDRWTIVFDDRSNPNDDVLDTSIVSVLTPDLLVHDQSKLVVMNNYFGIGADAQLALSFHEAREKNPEKFSSRFYNKFQYAKLGTSMILDQSRTSQFNLSRDVELIVDGSFTKLSNDIEGLIILNIPSWGSGGYPWGPHDWKFYEPSMSDNKIEVVAVTGLVHMTQIQQGLNHGIKVAQGSDIKIITKVPLPVQVDGEPWLQPAGKISITPRIDRAIMLIRNESSRKVVQQLKKGLSIDSSI